ncbi:MAG: cell division protein FtsA [Proteobacteria bacterium]|nr:cell division protein FtsA [Pseudomonadota bacterium]
MKTGLIAVLDIGSTKVACFIAHADPAGKLKIVGIGHQVSQGIRGGIIIDIKQAEGSIVAAVHAAEKMAGETIDRVLVNVSGSNLNSRNLSVENNISGHQVTERDIAQIMAEGYRHFAEDDQEILHCIPINYSIDDTHGISDPRGMFGEKLSTHLHIVTASSTAIRNLSNCLARCHLDIEDCVSSAYASGLACLTEDEKNLGVTLLDIGGGNTSIAVFVSGILVYTTSIALGGQHITRDIARGLSTSVTYAERLKTMYGSAVVTNNDRQEVLEVPLIDSEEESENASEMMHVSKSDVNGIIRPRVEEVFELAKKKLEAAGLDKAAQARIVLTGGTSQLVGIKDVAQEVFGRPIRISRPIQVEGMAESTKGAAFSTCVGMLKYAVRKDDTVLAGPEKSGVSLPLPENAIGRVIRWLQQNF